MIFSGIHPACAAAPLLHARLVQAQPGAAASSEMNMLAKFLVLFASLLAPAAAFSPVRSPVCLSRVSTPRANTHAVIY